MSPLAKSILALVLMLIGLVATLAMLTMMGRPKNRIGPAVLRRLHGSSGLVFLVLLLFLSYFMLKPVRMLGERLSFRAVFHGVLALALIMILLLKIGIARCYRELSRMLPALGMTVFVLTFLTLCTSAGYFFVVSTHPKRSALPAGAAKGSELFTSKCSFCHYSDSFQMKIGPGLKAILKKETLSSGRPATPENVKGQLVNPLGSMPSFNSVLTDEEQDQLLAYLRGL